MIGYEEFAMTFKEKVSEELGGMPEKGTIDFIKKTKVNCEVDGISFRAEGSNVAPCIYINDYYEMFLKSGDMDEVVKHAAMTLYSKRCPFSFDTEFKPGMFDGKIIFQVINTEQNKGMIANMPHRDKEDLTIIYRALLYSEDGGFGTIAITNDLAADLNLTEQELYTQAYENTKVLLEPRVVSMPNMLASMMRAKGEDEDCIEMMMDMFPDDPMMFVITNEHGTMGASAILYDEVLQNVAEKCGGDVVILPSSLHEVIAVPAAGTSIANVTGMVREVNATQVEESDRLSDNVYLYSKDARTFKMVSGDRDMVMDEPKKIHFGR